MMHDVCITVRISLLHGLNIWMTPVMYGLIKMPYSTEEKERFNKVLDDMISQLSLRVGYVRL